MEKLFEKIIEEMIKRISPEVKELLKKQVQYLELKAIATLNPWDDILVMTLKVVLCIK